MSWIKTAKVGDKVVCVDDKPKCRPVFVKFGCIYTIKSIGPWDGDSVGIALEEVEAIGPTKHFKHYRFNPVHRHDTDISIFTKMLNPEKAPVMEEA